MLLALGTAFRTHTLALIKLDNVERRLRDGVKIRIVDLIKTSRPGSNQPCACFPFFDNANLCIAKTLIKYMEVTENLRGETNHLLISFTKPHGRICAQSISRWLKLVMKEAGIDEAFTAHSTRHASTSKAASKGVDISIIRKAAGWAESSKTFARFYNRPLTNTSNNFAETVVA